jgi:small subunit ribosomal protein S1
MTENSEKQVNETPEETPQVEEMAPSAEAAEQSSETPEASTEEVESATEQPTNDEATSEEVDLSADEEEDDDDWWKDEDEYTKKERAEMEKLYDSTLRQFNENEIVKGKVVSIGEKETVLNIGFKSEGMISNSEFRDMPDLAPGDEVEVFIDTVEDQEGQLVLSRKRAKSMRTWEKINNALEHDSILLGTVERRTKGGFVADIEGIEAFLPGSQIDVKPVRDFDAYVGRTMEFKVVKINHAYENVVVSHKVLIEEKLEEQRQEILKNLEKGQVLEGTVKNMTNFGVFIDLGGVDGLLHITDISWGRINHPEEVLELDEKVNVVVLDFDEDKKRISLGMKQLTPHPWESLPENIQPGTQVKGKVVTVAEYGVFLEIMPGVEGLIHTSEMTWSQHIKNPTDDYKVGDELDAVVLNIDREDRKMSLGLKQLSQDPWELVEGKYPVGSTTKGIVRNMTNYGLFVELEDGVDGLVHISDLSWTKKFNHPQEFVNVGDELEVVVRAIDVENRRLSLSHKHLTEDVWETFASIFTIGSIHKGTIKRIDSKGARVELDYGIEGTVPSRHLKVEEGKDELKVDDTVDFMVIEFNKDAKKLVLSHTRTWDTEMPAEKRKATPSKRRSSGGGSKSATLKPKQSTTTLGEIGALAQLKKQMEAAEKGGGEPAPEPAAKKEEKAEEAKEAKKAEKAEKAEAKEAEKAEKAEAKEAKKAAKEAEAKAEEAEAEKPEAGEEAEADKD